MSQYLGTLLLILGGLAEPTRLEDMEGTQVAPDSWSTWGCNPVHR